jgi:ribonucleotide monophosphatase NagD (HAD superfamily)
MTCVIGIDIDGVLLHGSTPIEGSAEGLLTL